MPINLDIESIEIFTLRFFIAIPAELEPTYFASASSINKAAALPEAISVRAGSVFRSILRDASLDSL
ncbi:unannotated protein [freshwater metagenome]|uniref:Unannotated protein n=1 Tax=freshwater metagenome TaxID=449393 RepID=A0A6J6GBJ3_9ZZZZ